MKPSNATPLFHWPRALFAAATLLVAALLITQCISIYTVGIAPENMTATGVRVNDIYSREIVAERFSRIAWAVILWLALLAAALAVRVAKREPGNAAISITPETRLALVKARTELTPAMQAQERKRRIAALICAGVCAVCAALCCVYLFTPKRFASRDLEAVVGAMVIHTAPWIAVAFAALLLTARVWEKSLLSELEAAKDAPKRSPEPQSAQKRSLLPAGRIALYAAALALIVLGVLNGGMYDVLVKAINICTECIGLG